MGILIPVFCTFFIIGIVCAFLYLTECENLSLSNLGTALLIVIFNVPYILYVNRKKTLLLQQKKAVIKAKEDEIQRMMQFMQDELEIYSSVYLESLWKRKSVKHRIAYLLLKELNYNDYTSVSAKHLVEIYPKYISPPISIEMKAKYLDS